MRLKTNIVLSALALLLIPQFAIAQGNLVVNGGFDNISNGTNVVGWTLSGECYTDTKTGNPTPSLQLFGTAGADQTINSLAPGIIYSVSGNYQVHQASNFSFGVTIDGTKMFELLTSTDSDWHSFNFSYLATSSSVDLGIYLSEGQGSSLFNVDNISIQLVPEPSSEILLGFGSILLLGFGRWKTRAVR